MNRTQGQNQSVSGYTGSQENLSFEVVSDIFNICWWSILMDDNARPHRTEVVTDYMATETIERMDWPSLSPDLNPIEHAWDKLQQAVSAHPVLPRNREEFSAALVEEWNQLPQISSSGDLSEACRDVVALFFRHVEVIPRIDFIKSLLKRLIVNFPSFAMANFHSVLGGNVTKKPSVC